MKVKNIMFSGFMAAILTGVACSADAATSFQVASKQYVDARDKAAVAAQEEVDAKQDEDIAKKLDTTTYNTFVTAQQEKDRNQDTLISMLEGGEDGQGGFSDLVNRVSAAEAGINDLEEDVDILETNKEDVANKVVSVDELTNMQSDVKTQKYTSVAVAEAIAQSAATLATGAVENRVDTLESTVGDEESGLVKDVADLKISKQDLLTADSYIDVAALADNKVKVVVDGQIAAGNTGIVTGAAVYQYALPTPPEECSNTTCVLTTNQNGAPYWMQLWLPSDQEEMPENGSDA